ncbi:MAG: hypothetical protein IT158_06810 [Bryobacterales bacterium]|nr:hypothetical protein [Bryobacterales bacterium]
MFMRWLMPAVLACGVLPAQLTYQKPPKEILEVLHAPAPPSATVNPSGTHLLLLEPTLYPPIAELAAPMLRLAGLRINPANNGLHSQFRSFHGITVVPIGGGAQKKLAVPEGARLEMPEWSPDGRQFVVANATAGSIELYLGSVEATALRRISGAALNATTAEPVQWFSSSRELLVLLVPPGRGKPAAEPPAPAGPNIQESAGKAAGAWTFQDMLSSPHDEALFDYYATAQLASVSLPSGRIAPIGKPAIFANVSPAPDGRHILVSRIQRPYSYLLPYTRFPREVEVWDRAGHTVYRAASMPLEDKVPVDGVVTGPRGHLWRPTEQATLLWWEALDGGDPKVKVEQRDRLLMLKAPFSGSAREVLRTEHRGTGVQFGEAGGLALVSDFDRERRWRQSFRVFLDDPQAKPKLVWSLDVRDRYKDPGSPMYRVLPSGKMVMRQQAGWIFLRGSGATPEGERPFLDRMDLEAGQTERLFRSGPEGYEQVAALLSEDGSKLLTSYETPAGPPPTFLSG